MKRATGITIGNFDGVHRGHAELVRAARSAVGAGGRVVVLSFDPHPISVLRPNAAPSPLTAMPRRRQLLLDAGADEVIVLKPTRELLNLSAKDFIRSIIESESPTHFIEGHDFRFGIGREGSVDTLREHESEFGYRTIIIEPVEAALRNQIVVRVSSTMLRWLISRGRVEEAKELFDRPYELEGEVVRGDQRGRTIGFPTVNIEHGELLLPADGIYAGRAVLVDEKQHAMPSAATGTNASFPAAISIGTKPTFGRHPRVCEAHLIGYDGPLDHYGWTVRLEFHRWLRDQLVYRDADSLLSQIQRDVDHTRRAMRETSTDQLHVTNCIS